MAWNEPGKDRDPWGGGNNGSGRGDGDVDKVVRDLQRKLSGVFGGGRGNDNGSLFTVIAMVAVAVLAWEMVHIVQPGERGVVLRFGAHVATLEPGPAIRLPRPFERVIKVDIEQVFQYTHNALMLTQDENIVDVALEVQYRRGDAAAFLFNVVDPDMTLGQAAESAIREVSGKTTMDLMLGEGRAEVARATQELVQQTLDQYQAGITVVTVNLVDAQPPEPVQAAFSDAIRAREDQVRIINEAEAYSNDVIPRARGAAARQLEEANAYRESVIARARGEADRFVRVLAEYERAPAVTRERMYIEAVQEVLAGSHKVIVDLEGSGNLMVLPLDQLMQRAAESVVPPPVDAQAQSTADAARSARERQDARTRGRP